MESYRSSNTTATDADSRISEAFRVYVQQTLNSLPETNGEVDNETMGRLIEGFNEDMKAALASADQGDLKKFTHTWSELDEAQKAARWQPQLTSFKASESSTVITLGASDQQHQFDWLQSWTSITLIDAPDDSDECSVDEVTPRSSGNRGKRGVFTSQTKLLGELSQKEIDAVNSILFSLKKARSSTDGDETGGGIV